MTRTGHVIRVLVGAALLATFPAAAQQTPSDQVQQLQRQLDELMRQAAAIQQQLNQLQTGKPAEEDLTKIDVAAPAPPQAAPETQSALTDVQTINNIPNPGAAKVFNPDISVIGNFLGKAGQSNAIEFGEERAPMALDEAEVAFQAFVDPYAKANFFVSLTPEAVEIEEGYIQFVTLPYDLTAKAGKMKSQFGKDNTWHTHIRPWVDQPLVIHNFFGDEGLSDYGVSVSKIFANPWDVYIEGTGEAFSGEVENVFERQSHNDLFYNGHLKVFRDISENSNVEIGTSYARGTLAGAGGTSQFGGVDLTYRWKPLARGLYNSFIGRVEAVTNRRDDLDRSLKGFYASADYQLARRWFTGVRFDAAGRAFVSEGGPTARGTDRGVSATLTFWPSEFSQIRGQLRRTKYGDLDKAVNEALLQLQFSIGAHGAHTF